MHDDEDVKENETVILAGLTNNHEDTIVKAMEVVKAIIVTTGEEVVIEAIIDIVASAVEAIEVVDPQTVKDITTIHDMEIVVDCDPVVGGVWSKDMFGQRAIG